MQKENHDRNLQCDLVGESPKAGHQLEPSVAWFRSDSDYEENIALVPTPRRWSTERLACTNRSIALKPVVGAGGTSRKLRRQKASTAFFEADHLPLQPGPRCLDEVL